MIENRFEEERHTEIPELEATSIDLPSIDLSSSISNPEITPLNIQQNAQTDTHINKKEINQKEDEEDDGDPHITSATLIQFQIQRVPSTKGLDTNSISNPNSEFTNKTPLIDVSSRVVPPWMTESTTIERGRGDEDDRAVGGAPPPTSKPASATIPGGNDLENSKGRRGWSGAEVGASAKGEGEASGAPRCVTTRGEWLHRLRTYSTRSLCRGSPLVAKPPDLMAATFPWDREWGNRTEKKQDDVVVMNKGLAIDGIPLTADSSSSMVASASSSSPLFLIVWLERSFQKVRADDGMGMGM